VIYPSSSIKFAADSNILKMYLIFAEETLDNSLLSIPSALQLSYALLDAPSIYELHPMFLSLLLRMIEMVAETQHGEFTTRCKQGNHDTIVELSGHTNLRFYLSREHLEEIQAIYACICDNYATWRLRERKN
jgi:hypothetical protein